MMEAGQKSEALASFRKALQLDPDSALARDWVETLEPPSKHPPAAAPGTVVPRWLLPGAAAHEGGLGEHDSIVHVIQQIFGNYTAKDAVIVSHEAQNRIDDMLATLLDRLVRHDSNAFGDGIRIGIGVGTLQEAVSALFVHPDFQGPKTLKKHALAELNKSVRKWDSDKGSNAGLQFPARRTCRAIFEIAREAGVHLGDEAAGDFARQHSAMLSSNCRRIKSRWAGFHRCGRPPPYPPCDNRVV